MEISPNDIKAAQNAVNATQNSELNELKDRLIELELMVGSLRRINTSLASLTINETYKNFYDWKVKPAVDIVALMSSSALNMANVANSFANNVYSDKHEVKRAIKLTEKLVNEVEEGLSLYKREVGCMIKANGHLDICEKD